MRLISSEMRSGVLHNTRLAMRSGCAAASSRPMMPPDDSPTQCTRSRPSASITAMTWPRSSPACSDNLPAADRTRRRRAVRGDRHGGLGNRRHPAVPEPGVAREAVHHHDRNAAPATARDNHRRRNASSRGHAVGNRDHRHRALSVCRRRPLRPRLRSAAIAASTVAIGAHGAKGDEMSERPRAETASSAMADTPTGCRPTGRNCRPAGASRMSPRWRSTCRTGSMCSIAASTR